MRMDSTGSGRPLVAVGNWKLHMTVAEAVSNVRLLSRSLGAKEGVEVFVAPSFTSLEAVGQVLQGSPIGLSAQDLYWEDEGAYTGEVSPSQLVDVGCKATLIGHSERRQYFAETDESVHRKVKAALRHRLMPILCIGESLEQRKAGQTASVIERQIRRGLEGIGDEEAVSLVIAYEPLWAIGTGQVATPDQIALSHQLIRKRLSAIFPNSAERIPILYGGSVTPDNIQILAGIKELGGILVGGASLNIGKFIKIINGLARKVQEG